MALKKTWLPFDEARDIVASMKFTSYREFEQWADRPENIPSNPREVYRAEWVGRKFWIGTGPAKDTSRPKPRVAFLPYDDARVLAQKLMRKYRITSQTQWNAFAKSGDKPETIPADPSKGYKGKGWKGWPDWFGRKPARASGRETVKTFLDAREFARRLNLTSYRAWKEWAKSDECPKDIPYSPEERYEDQGWVGWGDFLGFHTRWTHRGIVGFLHSLQPVIQELSETELFLILTRNGMLGRDQRLSHAKLLKGVLRHTTKADVKAAADQVQKQRTTKSPKINEDFTDEVLDDPEDSNLCDIKSLEGLKVIDKIIEANITDDDQIIDFMIAARVSSLWKKVIEKDSEFRIDKIRAMSGGKYTTLTRDTFLQQHDEAIALPIPRGFAFSREGKLLEPNLMQRLTAIRLMKERRIGNWSGVGAGKTVAALFAAGACSARFTIVIAANSTIEDWAKVIKSVFPDAIVLGRQDEPKLNKLHPTFLVVNYESFQLTWSKRFIEGLLKAVSIDFVVLDEIQYIRQRRVSKRSVRRENVEKLLAGAVQSNADLRVLGMSATPVVNNLFEGKKLLEIISGQQFEGLPTGTTVGNAIALHTQLQRFGIRYVPSYEKLDLETRHPILDGRKVLSRILNVSSGKVLALEQAMADVKFEKLADWLGPKTIIYTHFVEGIVEPLRQQIEKLGYSVAVQTGRSKSKAGLNMFKSGEADVLIGSATIGTGVDGLQHVCNRLVFLSLPWSNAEYQQIIGRLHRQGSRFKKVEVIVPIVTLREKKAGIWSWDDKRRRCIEYKQTLADAALDGIIPQGRLPTKEELQRRSMEALKKWVERAEKGVPPESK